MELQDFKQPEENTRSIEVGKNVLTMRREDPYGFVTVHFERGEVPDILKGQFTSFAEATKKINTYLASRPVEGVINDSA